MHSNGFILEIHNRHEGCLAVPGLRSCERTLDGIDFVGGTLECFARPQRERARANLEDAHLLVAPLEGVDLLADGTLVDVVANLV